MLFGANVGKRVDDLVSAVDNRDNERFFAALRGIVAATPKARPDEVDAALARLTPVLAEIPFGMGGDLAQIAGSMADYGTDPAVVVPTLVGRAADAMEQAARFAALYGAAFGDLPDADDPEQIGPTIDRFVDTAPDRSMAQQDAHILVQAWYSGGQWVQPVLYLSQRKDVRAMLPERPPAHRRHRRDA